MVPGGEWLPSPSFGSSWALLCTYVLGLPGDMVTAAGPWASPMSTGAEGLPEVPREGDPGLGPLQVCTPGDYLRDSGLTLWKSHKAGAGRCLCLWAGWSMARPSLEHAACMKLLQAAAIRPDKQRRSWEGLARRRWAAPAWVLKAPPWCFPSRTAQPVTAPEAAVTGTLGVVGSHPVCTCPHSFPGCRH